eukprot:SAG31_NODE_545_length_14238_cov_15.518849_16_plen_97_part_00
MHVKGHSDDGGNDRADELVQWGKEDGPYARLREGGGEGESHFGPATNRAEDSAEEIIELDEALEALLADVDELIDSNSNFRDIESVIGNGVLLERQ